MKQFLSNPRAFVLLVAIILVSGLASVSTLPRAEDPHIGNRMAAVLTSFPGASASRVETLIAEPLENKLREIPEIDHIESRSSAGLASITLILKDSVHANDTEGLWAEVRDKLEEVGKTLPANAGAPLLDDQRAYSYTMIVGLNWKNPETAGVKQDTPDLMILGRYAKELENRLRGVYGTDYIKLHGQPREEILVDVDTNKAALLGMSVAQIGQAVQQADAKVSAGELHNPSLRMAVELQGALDNLERIRSIPLQLGAAQSALQVGDVATVSRQPHEPINKLAIIHGQPGVVLGVRMLADQRSDLWAQRIHQVLDDFVEQVPANIGVEVLFDQQGYTAARLGDLTQNIVVGFILILSVLLVTLGWRSALIVAMALPLTVLFAFSCMQYSSLPIHQISVTGLIVALGIMVDNAIVMVDTVDRYKQRGFSGLQATYSAVNHLWKPLLGSTLTTILAFMPIVLMPGAAGEFVGGISLTVIFSLIGSYLISHLLIAGFAGRFLKRSAGHGWTQHGVQLPGLTAWFKRSLQWSLVHPVKVALLVLVLPLLGFWGGSQLPQQFFPPSDRDMINFEVYLPSSSSLDATREFTGKITAELKDVEGIEALHWFVGGNAPSFYYNLMQRRDNSQYYAQAMLKTDNYRTANRLVPELQRRLDDRFPQAQIIIRRLEQGPPFNAPVEVRLIGPDLDQLKVTGEELRRRFLTLKDVVHVRSTLSDSIPKLWWNIDENNARKNNLSLTGIAAQLRSNVDGVISGSVLEQTESLPVRVQGKNYRRGDINEINSWILTAAGPGQPSNLIPLTSLGEAKIKPTLSTIPRRDGERVNSIEVYIRDGVLPAKILQSIAAQFDSDLLQLPAGYRVEFGGEDEQREMAITGLMASVGTLMVLLVIAVVMSFNSFRLSAVIFVVAVLAAGLGMLVLSVSGLPFGFTSIIGLMGLIGLAINAAIVILAELKSDPLAVAADSKAIVDGVSNCGRHIISTTATTVMGFIPLMLAGGAFWPPFALVIAGGTVLTTILSLFFVPVIFILMTRYRAFDVSVAAGRPVYAE